jgi:hypothetical protein
MFDRLKFLASIFVGQDLVGNQKVLDLEKLEFHWDKSIVTRLEVMRKMNQLGLVFLRGGTIGVLPEGQKHDYLRQLIAFKQERWAAIDLGRKLKDLSAGMRWKREEDSIAYTSLANIPEKVDGARVLAFLDNVEWKVKNMKFKFTPIVKRPRAGVRRSQIGSSHGEITEGDDMSTTSSSDTKSRRRGPKKATKKGIDGVRKALDDQEEMIRDETAGIKICREDQKDEQKEPEIPFPKVSFANRCKIDDMYVLYAERNAPVPVEGGKPGEVKMVKGPLPFCQYPYLKAIHPELVLRDFGGVPIEEVTWERVFCTDTYHVATAVRDALPGPVRNGFSSLFRAIGPSVGMAAAVLRQQGKLNERIPWATHYAYEIKTRDNVDQPVEDLRTYTMMEGDIKALPTVCSVKVIKTHFYDPLPTRQDCELGMTVRVRYSIEREILQDVDLRWLKSNYSGTLGDVRKDAEATVIRMNRDCQMNRSTVTGSQALTHAELIKAFSCSAICSGSLNCLFQNAPSSAFWDTW